MKTVTSIKVDFYKSSGKWYTTESFYSQNSIWEEQDIVDEIKYKFPHLSRMNYTFEAESENNETIKKLIIL